MSWRAQVAGWLGLPSVRAIRGATTVTRDRPDALHVAVQELLEVLQRENGLAPVEIISALFTVTPDLQCGFPAAAARALGWREVPLLCASEIAVPDGLPRCVRVLLHVERAWGGRVVRHVYLREAAILRPDLCPASAGEPQGAGGVPQRESTMPRTISTTPAPRRM